jgi:tetratricopeptide (TPR) repeat protein
MRKSTVQEFSGLHARYLKGEASDDESGRRFRAFYDTDRAFDKVLAAWIKQYPNSYAAYTARAHYWYWVGASIRGEGWGRDVSKETHDEMQRFHNLARADLASALRLSPKPIEALSMLMFLEKYVPNHAALKKYFEQAEVVDPNNTRAKLVYITWLNPNWSGKSNGQTDSALIQYADQITKGNFGDDYKKYIRYLVTIERADYHSSQHAYDQAEPLYLEAATLCPGIGTPLKSAINLQYTRSDNTKVITTAEQYLSRFKPNADILFKLGRSQYFVGQKQKSFDAYKACAELKASECKFSLAWFYEQGVVVTQDNRRASSLYWEAYQLGSPRGLPMALKTFFRSMIGS